MSNTVLLISTALHVPLLFLPSRLLALARLLTVCHERMGTNTYKTYNTIRRRKMIYTVSFPAPAMQANHRPFLLGQLFGLDLLTPYPLLNPFKNIFEAC